MRELCGLSGMQVAAELGWSQSKVSRIEAGRLGTSLNDLSALLGLYGVTEEVRAELLAAAVASDGLPGAWIVKAGGPPRRQGEVAAIEARVDRIRQYAAMAVPGLLQSESYMRAMARSAGLPDVEDIVSRRLARQELLWADNAPEYRLVLDERVLQRWPGGAGVMDEQLVRLAEVAELPNVHLKVLPVGSGAAVMSFTPFLIYDFRAKGAGPVVMLESQTADTYLSAVDDVASYGSLFDGLARDALSSEASAVHLRQLRERVAAWTL
jgi:transcriptional regulator with XRE-family HTH domain